MLCPKHFVRFGTGMVSLR
jgi:hypothetical protein